VLITQGKHPEARTLLDPVIQKASPGNRALAHYQMARSHYRKDELKEALAQLDQAAKADDFAVDTLRVHVLRGQVLEEVNRAQGAVKAYEKALALAPRNQEVLLSLVRLCLVAKDEMAALTHLRRYTQIVGKDVSGMLLAAESYFRMKRYDEALELALRAREINFHEKGQRIMGLVYLHRNDHEKAMTHLSKAEPDAIVLTGLIEATIAIGKVGELEKALTKAERLERRNVALDRQCERGRAILARRVVLEKQGLAKDNENTLDVLVCAEELAREESSHAITQSLLAQLFATKPIGPAYAVRGWLHLQKGRIREAREDAEKAIALSPTDASGYHLRGKLRFEVGMEGALADVQQALKLRPRDKGLLALLKQVEESGRR
jgi:tetratricopeptide (TPR) repeat protein